MALHTLQTLPALCRHRERQYPGTTRLGLDKRTCILQPNPTPGAIQLEIFQRCHCTPHSPSPLLQPVASRNPAPALEFPRAWQRLALIPDGLEGMEFHSPVTQGSKTYKHTEELQEWDSGRRQAQCNPLPSPWQDKAENDTADRLGQCFLLHPLGRSLRPNSFHVYA